MRGFHSTVDIALGARITARQNRMGMRGACIDVPYGVGKSLHEADKALSAHKAHREARGERTARGEKPPTATYRARGDREGLEAEGHVAEAKGVEHARI